jgi:DNA ligase (NAD+)
MKLHLGDEVVLQRSGDVIPKITQNLIEHNDFSRYIIPTHCPDCKSEVVRIILKVSGQENFYCSNKQCPTVLNHRLINWIRTLDIKGIGTKLIEKLIKRKYIKDIPDLYKLSPRRLMFIDKIKEKSANNIWKALHENKRVTIAELLGGIGIAGIALSTAEKLCAYFDYDLDKIRNANYATLCDIDGIAETLSTNIKNDLDKYSEIIEELTEILDIYNPNDKTSTKTKEGITGKKFCLSGAFNEGKKYYYDLIEKFGGIIKGSVVKDLDVLVSNETTTSKYKKAVDYGIDILKEKDLVKLLFE